MTPFKPQAPSHLLVIQIDYRAPKFEDHDDNHTYSNPQHQWETSVSRSKPSSRREQQKSVHFSNHGDVSEVFLYEGHTKESVARRERSSPSEESRPCTTREPSRKSFHDSTRDGNTHEEMNNCVDEIAVNYFKFNDILRIFRIFLTKKVILSIANFTSEELNFLTLNSLGFEMLKEIANTRILCVAGDKTIYPNRFFPLPLYPTLT